MAQQAGLRGPRTPNGPRKETSSNCETIQERQNSYVYCSVTFGWRVQGLQ
jgi:hypothetical protein